MKTINKLDTRFSLVQDDIVSKLNELIEGYNSLILSLKPSAHPERENRGYQNMDYSEKEFKELGQHNSISTDPNDK